MSQSSNIFSVSSNGNLGATFLEWSIYWISGRSTYYHCTAGSTQLISNPLKSSAGNAHLHRKNHPSGFVRTKATVDNLLLQSHDFAEAITLPVCPSVTLPCLLPGPEAAALVTSTSASSGNIPAYLNILHSSICSSSMMNFKDSILSLIADQLPQLPVYGSALFDVLSLYGFRLFDVKF
jgi:hypothetical protein